MDEDVDFQEANVDVLIDLEWRIYPAAVLAFTGAATAWLGISLLAVRLRETPADMIGFVTGFRIAVIGMTLVGLAISWNWHITWLFVLAVVFGAEEVLESTTHLAILRWKPGSPSPSTGEGWDEGVMCPRR